MVIVIPATLSTSSLLQKSLCGKIEHIHTDLSFFKEVNLPQMPKQQAAWIKKAIRHLS